MQVTIDRVERGQHDALRQLMQLYVYDFSPLLGLDVEDSGRFADRPLEPYWDDATRSAHFIRVEGRLAGFALIRRGSRLSDDANTWDMEEFFVLRRYRRRRVGEQAAHALFASHRGPWEIRQRTENAGATTFWRHAIASYTANSFTQSNVDNERWRGIVQSFVS